MLAEVVDVVLDEVVPLAAVLDVLLSLPPHPAITPLAMSAVTQTATFGRACVSPISVDVAAVAAPARAILSGPAQ